MGLFEKKHRNPLAGGSFFSFLRNSGDMVISIRLNGYS